MQVAGDQIVEALVGVAASWVLLDGLQVRLSPAQALQPYLFNLGLQLLNLIAICAHLVFLWTSSHSRLCLRSGGHLRYPEVPPDLLAYGQLLVLGELRYTSDF